MEVFISFSILDSEFAVSEPNQAVISYLIKLSSTELQKNTHNHRAHFKQPESTNTVESLS